MPVNNVQKKGPAFSAYLSSNQTPTANVLTKIAFDAEEFDTNSNYDNATNFRFTPTVEGYYKVNAGVMSSGAGAVYMYIRKNGTAFKRGNGVGLPSGALGPQTAFNVDALIYMNGTTDYLEIYALNSAGAIFQSGLDTTYFQAVLARGI